MPDTRYPFQMTGGVPVVTAPAEVDVTSAAELQAILAEWHSRGHATIVVDMTGTCWCDSAGIRVLVQAHQRAVADGGELRLVTPAEDAVARIFTLAGPASVVPRFASLPQAVAQVSAAAGRLLRRGARPGPAAEPLVAPPQAEEPCPSADNCRCEQCGAVFVPRREHARFCGPVCRAVWNREHLGDPAAQASALAWSVAAMSEATARLPRVRIWDKPGAVAAIAEAVWWITMVDATLVRHHQGIYDAAMAARADADRVLLGQILAGLRFVRNWMGRDADLSEIIDPGDTGAVSRRITGWRWKHVPAPPLAELAPRGQAWEMARYRAYQAQLAGCTFGETLGRAATFLTLTGASATSITDPGASAVTSAADRGNSCL